jgi:hypothetical protein
MECDNVRFGPLTNLVVYYVFVFYVSDVRSGSGFVWCHRILWFGVVVMAGTLYQLRLVAIGLLCLL